MSQVPSDRTAQTPPFPNDPPVTDTMDGTNSLTNPVQDPPSPHDTTIASIGDRTALVQQPQIIYGTAWKKERTRTLVMDALKEGFRAIDTAAQPKHYNESQVGEAWTAAFVQHEEQQLHQQPQRNESLNPHAQDTAPPNPPSPQPMPLRREDLFLQTKFTPVRGQDMSRPIPYDPQAPLADQVAQSIASSLRNLRTHYVDSLVLHSPLPTLQDTVAVWRAFELAVDQNLVRQIGISNCYDLQTLQAIYQEARIKPTVVQNRFYAASSFDVDLRRFCAARNITYQSFWTLTANDAAIDSAPFRSIANQLGLTPAQTMYAFVRSLGIVPLCGTTDVDHMAQDLLVVEASGPTGNQIVTAEVQQKLARIIGVPL